MEHGRQLVQGREELYFLLRRRNNAPRPSTPREAVAGSGTLMTEGRSASVAAPSQKLTPDTVAADW